MAGVREGAQLLRAGLDAALDTFKDEVAPATPEDAVAVSNETEQRVRAARHCQCCWFEPAKRAGSGRVGEWEWGSRMGAWQGGAWWGVWVGLG